MRAVHVRGVTAAIFIHVVRRPHVREAFQSRSARKSETRRRQIEFTLARNTFECQVCLVKESRAVVLGRAGSYYTPWPLFGLQMGLLGLKETMNRMLSLTTLNEVSVSNIPSVYFNRCDYDWYIFFFVAKPRKTFFFVERFKTYFPIQNHSFKTIAWTNCYV